MNNTVIETPDDTIEITTSCEYVNPLYRRKRDEVRQRLIPKFIGPAHDE